MGGDDDLVHRRVLVEGVAHRLERIRVDDRAARGDPSLVEEVERPAEAAVGARAAAVLVDDEARRRIVLRRDDRDADRALRGPLFDRLEERPARDGLVGDDEDVTRPGGGLGRGLLVRVSDA
jgi:hypothetical protein